MNRRALLLRLLAVPSVALGLKTVGPTEEGLAGKKTQRVDINVDNKAEWEAFLQEIHNAIVS